MTESENESKKRLLRLGGFVAATYIGLFLIGFVGGLSLTEIYGQLISITVYAGVFGLLALALNLHWGYTGMFNIGIAGFMAIGVYTMVFLTAPPDPVASPVGGLDLPILVGVLGGVVVAAVAGALLAIPTLRVRADYFAIITLGFSEIVRLFIQSDTLGEIEIGGQIFGTGAGRSVRYSNLQDLTDAVLRTFAPSTVFDAFEALGFSESLVRRLFYALVAFLFMLAVLWLLRRIARSPFGRVLKAIREDETAARSLGKDTRMAKITVFALGSGLMGLGGILWHGQSSFVEPDLFLPIYTFFIFIALIIGGSGSNLGAMVGGFAFAAFLWDGPRYLRTVVSENLDIDAPQTIFDAGVALLQFDAIPMISYLAESLNELRWIFIGIVLIMMMLYRPEGLYGDQEDTAAAVDLTERPTGGDNNE